MGKVRKSAPPPPGWKAMERPKVDPTKVVLVTDPNDDETDEEDAFDYCSETRSRIDRQVYRRYIQQMEESDGFDIKDFPGVCYMTTIVPLSDFENSPSTHQTLIELATLAIQQYNTQHQRTKYKFLKVEKANAMAVSGIIYYITFQAEERKCRNPAVKTFQARMWKKITPPEIGFQLCRLKKKTATNDDEKVASESAAE